MDPLVPEALLPPGYDVCRRRLDLGGEMSVQLFQVADPNALSDAVDAEAFEEDERFPYWAELWPSGIALARFVTRLAFASGTAALELGCGLGLAGVAAALKGAQVLFTDFDADALAFASANHALNLGSPGRTRLVDWRSLPPGLCAPLVLASDVLYERRFLGPFLGALRAAVSSGGVAYVAEPGRKIAQNTLETLEADGFSRVLHLEEVEHGGRFHEIWIHELRRLGEE